VGGADGEARGAVPGDAFERYSGGAAGARREFAAASTREARKAMAVLQLAAAQVQTVCGDAAEVPPNLADAVRA